MIVPNKNRLNTEYRISKFGEPSVITATQTQLATPKAGEVQLRILATGLSMADVLIRRGVYVDIKKPDVVLGYEALGVIEVLGEGVALKHPNLTVGKQVAVMSLIGNNTHYRNIEVDSVVPLPKNVSHEQIPQAASIMLNYVTAYQMLHRQQLTYNQTATPEKVLIHSAAGGVGMALIQLLKPFNLELYGTASKKNHVRLKRYGVKPIDYHTENVAQVCQQAGGMDVVFDGIGGNHLNLSKQCLTQKGQLIFYGMTELITGEQPTRIAFIKYMLTSARYLFKTKLCKRYAFYSITDYRKKQPQWFIDDFNKVFNLFLNGTIKPELAPVLPLSQIAEAHRKLEFGELSGKQVLIPDPLFIK